MTSITAATMGANNSTPKKTGPHGSKFLKSLAIVDSCAEFHGHCSIARAGGFGVPGEPADLFEGRRNEFPDQRALVKPMTLMGRRIHNLGLAG